MEAWRPWPGRARRPGTSEGPGTLVSLLLALCVVLLAPLATGAFATGSLLTAPARVVSPLARVVELTNAERRAVGLAPLAANGQLARAAQGYAEVLATSACWGHACGAVPDFRQRLVDAGYADWRYLGENVAGGQRTPELVVAAWMASPAHRANILHPAYTEIGVGLAYGGRLDIYWAQEFGAQRGDAPVAAYRATWIAQAPVAPLAPSAQARVFVDLQNTGTATWVRDGPRPLRLGTDGARDRASAFATPGEWLSANRPAELVQERVPPGYVGRFAFTLTAPATPGRYQEHFRPVVEGERWLDDLGIAFEIDVRP
ncbi:MAG: hypothetical protein HYU88_02655 [Chloroflexi bacterium]|nr:hypothetical protein [Chloroflexota bacterium]